MLARKALAGTAGAPKVYVEDVFSTYLYTGNDSTKTITNNIDLSTEGGMVWAKSRTLAANHRLTDTVRGAENSLLSNSTLGNQTAIGNGAVTSFASSGYITNLSGFNSTDTHVSWTFRKAEKFFDVVTWTGNGANYRTISHLLGSTPGMVIVKSTSASGAWAVWHRSADPNNLILNSTSAPISGQYSIQDVTSSNFSVADSTFYGFSQSIPVNDNGQTYVAYLFAHNAGGFGDAGSDNVITCGSFTTNGSGVATVTLGYEPQWVLVKQTTGLRGWFMYDIMRGMFANGGAFELRADLSNSENDYSAYNNIAPTATGFVTGSGTFSASTTYIYIAIRKGPMKTPETGTSVFTPTAFSGNDTSGTRSAGLNAFDLLIAKRRGVNSLDWVWLDKLRSLAGDKWLASNATTAEGGGDIINTINGQYTQDGINVTKSTNYAYLDSSGNTYVWYALKRAPKFFDVVCYTGTGSATTVSHNLGVAPELVILKRRNGVENWPVLQANIPTQATLNGTFSGDPPNSSYFGNGTSYVAPTSTVFSVGTNSAVNASGGTYVAYLFASLSGVSKVGSYTGNGSSQTINCGFTAGARFVLIKQTDSAGNWYVFDTARGIVSGGDPLLSLNTADAEDTPARDALDPDNSGFIVNNDAAYFPINVNNATYIYLAIA